MNADAAFASHPHADRFARHLAAELPPGYTLRSADIGHGPEWWVYDERGNLVDAHWLGAPSPRQRTHIALLLALCVAGLVIALGLYAG